MSTESMPLPQPAVAPTALVDRLHGWVTTVDHKRLGILYIVYALVFLVIGGIEAAIMRIQLIAPQSTFVSPQVFNRLFTMHGTTMIFFVVMPLVFGFANYLVPLMIGARDMAFPRLNAFSFWLTAFGGLPALFQLARRQRPVRGGQRAGRRLVRLRAADVADLLAGPQHRFLDAEPARLRLRQHRHGDQHHHDDRLHAMPRHDARADAAVRLAEPGHGRDGDPGGEPAVGRADHAARRPLSRRPFLRHAGRRLGGDLDALLLDLRPSRGLRARPPGIRHGIRDHPGLLAQADLRLRGHGRPRRSASASSR